MPASTWSNAAGGIPDASATDAVEFLNILTSPDLLETTESLLPEHRERVHPPTVTLAMFMCRTLEADGSCQNAVKGWAAQRDPEGLSASSVRAGAYCKARPRFSLRMVTALTRGTSQLLSRKVLTKWKWCRRAVKLVNGTVQSKSDTPENRAVFPQLSTQARIVAVICPATCAALGAAIAPRAGKGSGELTLVHGPLVSFEDGDSLLADAMHCNYFLIETLLERDVDLVFEQNGARMTDFTRGLRLDTRDHIVFWPKSARPEQMTPEEHADMPDDLMLREAMVDHQVLVTTMVSARVLRKSERSERYA